MKKRGVKIGIFLLIVSIILIGFIFTQEVSKNKIGEKFGLKADEVIVGDPENIKIEQNKIILSKAQSIIIKGFKYDFPENTNIIFNPDGSVKIELPNEAEIKDPVIVDQTKISDIKFIFSSKDSGKLKLPSGDLFDGTISYEVKAGKGQYFTEDKKTLTFGKILIDNNEGKRIDLYFDGEKHESVNKVVSIGKEKLSLQNGASATFDSGNRILERMIKKHYVSITAKEKSSVTITKRGEIIPLIETYGDFVLFDGKEKLFTGLDREKRMDIMKDPITSGKTGELAYPLELVNYAKDGKELLWKDAKKKLVVDVNGNWAVVKFEEISKKFSDYGLKEDGSTTTVAPPVTTTGEETPRVTIVPADSGRGSTTPIIEGASIPSPSASLRTNPARVQFDRNNILGYVEAHTRDRDNSDKVTKIHEELHFANSDLTTAAGYFADYSPKTSEYRAFLTDEGIVLVKNTGFSKSAAASYVPQGLREDFPVYFGRIHSGKDAIHCFEDMYPYILGANEVFRYTDTTGRTFGGEGGAVRQSMFPFVHSAAVGMLLEERNQGYWNSEEGKQFKAFLAKGAEKGIGIYNLAREKPEYGGYMSGADDLMTNLRTSQEAGRMRDFFIRTYGAEWTKRVLGF